MPLIPLRPLLETVDKYHFAQGAFNVNAVAQAKAAIEVHEMFRSAAILQGADLANGFMGGRTDFQNATLEDKKIGAKNIADAVKKYAENSPIPVVLHLDHGKNFDSCKAAIEGGVRQEVLQCHQQEREAHNQYHLYAVAHVELPEQQRHENSADGSHGGSEQNGHRNVNDGDRRDFAAGAKP